MMGAKLPVSTKDGELRSSTRRAFGPIQQSLDVYSQFTTTIETTYRNILLTVYTYRKRTTYAITGVLSLRYSKDGIYE